MAGEGNPPRWAPALAAVALSATTAPQCEGTGRAIDWRAFHAAKKVA